MTGPLPAPPDSTPAAPTSPAANGTAGSDDDRQHQMEKIAGSLEDVARQLRGRGLSALFRNEPDPLNQRLLSVIADHLAARGTV